MKSRLANDPITRYRIKSRTCGNRCCRGLVEFVMSLFTSVQLLPVVQATAISGDH